MLASMKKRADWLGIVGALILFFTYIFNNTLREDFQDEASSFEASKQKLDEFYAIDSIRIELAQSGRRQMDMLIGLLALGAETIPAERLVALEPIMRHRQCEFTKTSAILNAAQIEGGIRFCLANEEYSRLDDDPSAEALSIKQHCDSLFELRDRRDSVFEELPECVEGSVSAATLAELGNVIQNYEDELVPAFGQEFAALVDAVNARKSELDRARDEAVRKAEISDRVALFFYVIGTLLVIFRTYLKNVVKDTGHEEVSA